MEETTKQKLIESYVPKLWMANTADDIRKILNDYSDAYDSINCLEAKPKALHSMKCDERICPNCKGSGEILNSMFDAKACGLCNGHGKLVGTRPSRGH